MTNFHLYKTEQKIKPPARYDVFNNELEIKTTAGLMILPTKLVDYFTLSTLRDSTRFINSSNFTFDNTVLEGFLEVLCEGKIQLFKLTKAEVVKPSYNPSLEVGDRDSYIVKKTILFYSLGDKKLIRVKGKSEMMELFSQDTDQVKSFISKNRLGVKNENDLRKILDFYNGLK